MATRMLQRRGTAEQWTTANPVLGAGEIGFETDTGKFKVGDNVNTWSNLSYFVNSDDLSGELGEYATQEYVNDAVSAIVGTAPEILDTIAEIADAINNDVDFFNSITQTAQGFADQAESNAIAAAETHTNAQVLAVSDDLADTNTNLNNLSGSVDTLSDVVDGHTTELDGIQSTLTDQTAALETANSAILTKAPSENPTFTGTVSLPTTTSVGDVSSAEIGHLNGVTSAIQTQIDAKLDSGVAAGTYAPLNDPTFGGTVSLPSTTSIGDVSSTEVGYLNGVTSSIQTQLNAKAPTNNPSFEISQLSLGTPTQLNGAIPGEDPDLAGVATYFSTAPNFDLEFFNEGDLDFLENSTIGFLNSDVNGTNINGILFTTGTAYFSNDANAWLLPITTNSSDATAVNAWLAVAGGGYSYNLVGFSVAIATVGSDISISSAELKTLDGITSNIQTQLNTKASSSDITDLETALDAKASLAGATFTGNVEVDGNLVVDGDFTVNGTNFAASATSITIEDNLLQLAHENAANTVDLGLVVGYNDGALKHAGIVRDVSDDRWKLFKGVSTEPATTVAFGEGTLDDLQVNNITAAGVVFTDGTQTKAGVPSLTEFVEKTTSYDLADLGLINGVVEMNSSSPMNFEITANSVVPWPVGASMDIIQTGTGEVTISAGNGVTVNATPGLKLRTQWSSATILKRAENSWIAYGDLKAQGAMAPPHQTTMIQRT